MVQRNRDQQSQGRPVEIKVKHRYPDDFTPAGISYVALSRVGADVQLDLGFMNIQQFAEQMEDPSRSNKSLDVKVAFSAYLTPNAFAKLHADVNRFYELMQNQTGSEE